MVIFCGNTLLATVKGLKFTFPSFFNDAYSITNFTHVKCMRFSRTTLLPVTLQNCFATVEGASRTMNGKEIRSRFARGKYVGNVENRERIRTSSSRSQERRHALLLPHSRSQEQKCVAPKKEGIVAARRKMIRRFKCIYLAHRGTREADFKILMPDILSDHL